MNAARRTRVRLLARDLSAAAAFGAMAISGELPVWTVALFALGLIAALFGLRPLARVGLSSGIGVAAAAAMLYANVAIGGMDLVVAACAFASIITLHRMLSAPGPRTDQQVLLTSLLMISGGAALSGELLFAVMLLLFAILACIALSLAVVERAVPPGADFSTAPVLRRIGLGVVAAMVGAAVCFLFIPRMNWNALGRRPSKGLGATTGLNDGIRLGGSGGSIKTNPRVVARIHLEPDPGVDALNAHWVASTYSDFDGTAWFGTGDRGAPQRTWVQLEQRPGSKPIRQEIELLPAYGSHVAFALADPLSIGHATAQIGTRHQRVAVQALAGLEVRLLGAAPAYTYFAYSSLAPRTNGPQQLEPRDQLRLTRLPAKLDPRIPALAAQVLGGEKDPRRAAQKLERYLKDNYGYTLDLPDSPADPLADFLFDRRKGHCEYFASALAVLLRSQGFAARVVTGFFGGERVGDEYVLRAGDAHAWTQVFVPGEGFVTFDATPESGRTAQSMALLAWLTAAYERLDTLWRGSVLEFSLQDQAGALRTVKRFGRGPGRFDLPRRSTWMAAAVLALAIYAAWRLRRPRAERVRPHPATVLRERAERKLAEAGIEAQPGEGFQELTARLAAVSHPAAPACTALCARYVEARFGGRTVAASEAQALLDALDRALGGHTQS
ncbi:MAG: DUF3488 domain-containing protein [Myxococcaceae bacterium]|nr:DUF3488 domain-containing protein [Myxococcaceae bacterium]